MSELAESLIALQLTPYLGEKTLSRVLEGGSGSIMACFSAGEEQLREDYHLHPQAARHLAQRKDRLISDARMLMAALRRTGADLLHLKDSRYPEQYRKLSDPPPLLYASGDLDLLEEPSVCFLASSGATPPTLERIRSLADRITEEGYPVVTGHNRNVYQAVALAAAHHSSPVIYVLDCGLFSATGDGFDQPFPTARIHPAKGQRRLFLSPFRPKDPWIGHNNRRRDRLISALAHILMAVDVRPGGVMEKECRAALSRGQRVVALAPDGCIPDAHDHLFQHGAMLIQNPEELLRHLWDAGIQPP